MSDKATHRLLVIDDNPAIHDDFRKILLAEDKLARQAETAETAIFGGESKQNESPRFEIDCVLQGASGLALVAQARANKRPYALAFVDVRMPAGWDGIETVKR